MEGKQIKYCWYWNTNTNPFDKSEKPDWAPYDFEVNIFMEENYQNGIYRFEVDIGNNTYIMDLSENFQILKIDPSRKRPIIRARTIRELKIIWKNRFPNLISRSKAINKISDYDENKNIWKKMKVREILGIQIHQNSETYSLLNQEIVILSKICEELKCKFSKLPTGTKFNKEAEIVSYIAGEIIEQAERLNKIDENGNVINTLDKYKDSTYINHAKYCIEKLKNLDWPLHKKLIFINTLEGFLYSSLISNLRKGSMVNCSLLLYFILLQASLAIASTKFDHFCSMKALQTLDGKEYYKLYRAGKISEHILLADKQSQSKQGSGKYIVYNEFLSTSYDQTVAERFLKHKNLKDDQVKVLYSFLIPKKEADTNPNIMCFIEDLSCFRNEREVVIFPSSIFQIQKIENNQNKRHRNESTNNIDYYEVTLIFISNGFNQLDSIKIKESLISKEFMESVTQGIYDLMKRDRFDLYSYVEGKVNKDSLEKCKFDNADTDLLLHSFISEVKLDSLQYKHLIVKEESIGFVFDKNFTLTDLTKSLKHFCNNSKTKQDYNLYYNHAQTIFEEMKKKFFKNIGKDDKKKVNEQNKADEEIMACCLSISYYTGDGTSDTNRVSNAVMRAHNSGVIIDHWKDKEQIETIIYYLNKALNYLPLFWGTVTRCMKLPEEELKKYEPGNVVTWLNYSSSTYGDKPLENFYENSNTVCTIYSLKGRDISSFSMFKNEREILFMPFSQFLVFEKTFNNSDKKYYIKMRQVDFTVSGNKNIIWVDDMIFEPKWENKSIIEEIYSEYSSTVNIYPKNRTESVMSFLTCEVNIYKLRQLKKFIIISDMGRFNEESPENAGARFYKLFSELKYTNCSFIIYTGDIKKAVDKLKELHVSQSEIEQIHIADKQHRLKDHLFLLLN